MENKISHIKVFLSYSRKDEPFVAGLAEELFSRGVELIIDRKDISPGEPWRERLRELMLAADAVLFLISPSSLSSEVCSWEMQQAFALTKRVVPFVLESVAVPETHPLSALNWLYADDPLMGSSRPERPSTASLEKLAKVVSLDLAWERE